MLTTVQQRAVRLGFGLIMNHPFNDGNKRIGAHATLTILSMQGIELEYTQKELHEVILEVANVRDDFKLFLRLVCLVENIEKL